MAGFIAQQPNGLYCRFSTTVDCPTHYNLDKEDYAMVIENRGKSREEAKKEAEDIIKNYLRPFDEVINRFVPNNMTEKEFEEWLKEVGYKGDYNE